MNVAWRSGRLLSSMLAAQHGSHKAIVCPLPRRPRPVPQCTMQVLPCPCRSCTSLTCTSEASVFPVHDYHSCSTPLAWSCRHASKHRIGSVPFSHRINKSAEACSCIQHHAWHVQQQCSPGGQTVVMYISTMQHLWCSCGFVILLTCAISDSGCLDVGDSGGDRRAIHINRHRGTPALKCTGSGKRLQVHGLLPLWHDKGAYV